MAENQGNNPNVNSHNQRQENETRNPAPRPPRPRRRNPGQPSSSGVDGEKSNTDNSRPRPPRPGRRGVKFNPGLTDAAESSQKPSDHAKKPDRRTRHSAPPADDLTSILTHAFKTPPYPDCPICFNAVHPAQPTWSCSSDIITEGDAASQCCWTTFHLKCIRSWAAKSVKDLEDAWRARGENRRGEWRCPGCQAKRDTVPTVYLCFCHRTSQPAPARLATPHSCGLPCARIRPSGCGHPCPLQCHPGPCPPCAVTVSKACHCGREVTSFRCSTLTSATAASPALGSCGRPCGKQLTCGNPAHICAIACHPGDCDPCVVTEVVKCFCGKEQSEVNCGVGKDIRISCSIAKGINGKEERWEGRFKCGNICNRPFDCHKHTCQRACHPPSGVPPPCPFSPERVTRCPCGQTLLSEISAPPRTSCASPIPTCPSRCSRPHPSCEHACDLKCHTGACPPCTVKIVKVCRCGGTKREIRCGELAQSGETEIMCDRPCKAIRACGQHQCNRICCPLASFARTGKGKKRNAGNTMLDMEGLDDSGLHECDLVCDKVLSCGNHRCEAKDHRGPCAPCLRSTFSEILCLCGRTTLEPPIPCGTRLNCTYPCVRRPPCGHDPVSHPCHETNIVVGSDAPADDQAESPCPPCPFLTKKRCACGKKMVDNTRCSQERVSCGAVCGRLLGCGFHHCERLCHGDECGECNSVCGKSRKSCLPAHHPCTQTCHAPASCPENEPCLALVTLTCPCGLKRSTAACSSVRLTKGQMKSSGEYVQLKCSGECALAQRNARLADALGISPEIRNAKGEVVYKDDSVAFARLGSNAKFVALVEKTFADFVTSEKKLQVLPHMPPERRKFVNDLASVYRMDTTMVDQEPHRSVQLIRRIDTRIPQPLLSTTIASTSQPNLGKLADMRSGSRTPLPAPVPAPTSGGRWTSVVSRPVSAAGTSGGGGGATTTAGKAGAQPARSVNLAPTAPMSIKPSSGAWVSPSVRAQRATAGEFVPQAPPQTSELKVESPHDVPDNWEDDV